MIKQERIGVQFNFDKNIDLKTWLKKFKIKGTETNGDHITIKFSDEELKINSVSKAEKLNLIIKALEKYAKYSSYTNIYTFIDVDRLKNKKSELLSGELKDSIRMDNFISNESILKNYDPILKSEEIKEVLKQDKITELLDSVFRFLNGRNFEKEQRLALELFYEDEYVWRAIRDNLQVSIQLEKL